MALQETTLTNSNAGTITSTNASHDANMDTYDDLGVVGTTPVTMQWGFSGKPVNWKKFRARGSAWGAGGIFKIYIIPAGETNPANYILVFTKENISTGEIDETYEHGNVISADGIYLSTYATVDAGTGDYVREMQTWHEPTGVFLYGVKMVKAFGVAISKLFGR